MIKIETNDLKTMAEIVFRLIKEEKISIFVRWKNDSETWIIEIF